MLSIALTGSKMRCPAGSRKQVSRGKSFLIGSGKLSRYLFGNETCGHARCQLCFRLSPSSANVMDSPACVGGPYHFTLDFLCYYR